MKKENKIILGCIADDFTGGSDAASFLALGGMKTILCNGIPGQDFKLPQDCEAVVIALKSRTQEVTAAVRDSLSSIRWLKDQGADKFYFKYCSTFDSTDQGNIGPVTDAILEELDEEGTILCPALPANERVVRDGLLYVKGLPLAESPMRNHPLTPMRKSRIADLMGPQGGYDCLEIHGDEMEDSMDAVRVKIDAFRKNKQHWYAIPDYRDEEDAGRIISIFGDMTFLTGGSGILTALAKHLTGRESVKADFKGVEGKALIVGGSCSVATHAQTLWYEKNGGSLLKLDDQKVISGEESPEAVFEEISAGECQAPMVYSYDTPEGLAKKRNEEGRLLAAKVEATLSGIARIAAQNGFKRIIAAGGETSGAVTQALGYQSFWIGESIAPGVPVLIPLENQEIRLVLKSGNFGQEDFFGRALAMTGLQH
ncbi:MAG: four-carbon acid sugar kinase family protein [Eubacterium sp.]|nr:four-carbon acid sugar kinase family protein [Eubacterium sp.]